ncbi:MAG: glycosyltransferase family 2 protein [Christensenellaceae bacterium]|jgi:cellulose synthase/poly-beta-1,6-N-acetylglucosamine synthase-like glycosyltransferase|nr:glycosyltransferase family 2 protein [Christensenellaceae bacterium]
MVSTLKIAFLVYIIITVVALLCYIPRITYFFWAFQKTKKLNNPVKNKLCILIAARNEPVGIIHTLDGLLNQTYDRQLYEIVVVVSKFDDTTIDVVKTKYPSVELYVAQNTKSKGEALDNAVKHFFEEKREYASYVLVDADNIVKNNFVEEANNAMMMEAGVIVFKKKVKNFESTNKKSRSLFCNCAGLVWIGVDDMGNKYRSSHNIACNMTGTGLMVKAEVLKAIGGFPCRTLTEDYELMCECMIRDIKTTYYEHAAVYTEEAVTHKEASKRRIRWLKGFTQCQKIYKGKIKEQTFDGEEIKFQNFDFLYGILPLLLFAVGAILGIAVQLVSGIVLLILQNNLCFLAFMYGGISLLFTYVLLVLYTLYQMIVAGKSYKISFWSKVCVLFFNPFYISEYILIYFKAKLSKECSWEVVERVPFSV